MKLERHRKILELINTYDIETQEELADLLNNQGYNVTQATVSRDIRQLKLIKKNINGKQKYAVIQGNINDMNEKYIRVLKDGFVSVAMAQNILVIKTVSGMAMAVAAALDAMKWKEIVGCIAFFIRPYSFFFLHLDKARAARRGKGRARAPQCPRLWPCRNTST